MESSISYEEIETAITNLNKIKGAYTAEIDNAVSAIDSYKTSGLTIDAGSYEDKLQSIVSDLKNEKDQILSDCSAIEAYLRNIAEAARKAVQDSAAAAESVSTFTASGEIVKRA